MRSPCLDSSSDEEHARVDSPVLWRFIMRACRPSIETPFRCRRHPIFEDIPNTPQQQRDFFDHFFMKEGDIFEEFMFDWEPVKELILKEIFKGMQELESFNILDVSDLVASKVADTVAAAEKTRNNVIISAWRR